MGAYDSLKSLVRQYIKTNGQNEITGQILQNVLIAMIDELGITIDPTPIPANTNAVESGGVFFDINDKSIQLCGEKLENSDGLIAVPYNIGEDEKIIEYSTGELSSGTWPGYGTSELIELSPKDNKYVVKLSGSINNARFAAFVIYDKNYSPLFIVNSSVANSPIELNKFMTLDLPYSAKYIRFSYDKSHDVSLYAMPKERYNVNPMFSMNVARRLTDLNKVEETILEQDAIFGKPLEGYITTDYIAVTKQAYKNYYVYLGAFASIYTVVAFYDAQKNLLKAVDGPGIPNYIATKMELPNGTAFVRYARVATRTDCGLFLDTDISFDSILNGILANYATTASVQQYEIIKKEVEMAIGLSLPISAVETIAEIAINAAGELFGASAVYSVTKYDVSNSAYAFFKSDASENAAVFGYTIHDDNGNVLQHAMNNIIAEKIFFVKIPSGAKYLYIGSPEYVRVINASGYVLDEIDGLANTVNNLTSTDEKYRELTVEEVLDRTFVWRGTLVNGGTDWNVAKYNIRGISSTIHLYSDAPINESVYAYTIQDANGNPLDWATVVVGVQREFYVDLSNIQGAAYLYVGNPRYVQAYMQGIIPTMEERLSKLEEESGTTPSRVFTDNNNILWLGTSIPEGAQYPAKASAKCGYSCINNALGGSQLCWSGQRPATVNEYSGRCLTATVAELEAMFRQDVTAGTITEATLELWKNKSYERSLLPYINGTNETQVSMIVLDHGFNDRVNIHSIMQNPNAIDWTSRDRSNFVGAFNYLMDRIQEIKPTIKIVISGYFQNTITFSDYYSKDICDMQTLIAEHYSIAIMKAWEHTQINNSYVAGSSNYLQEFNTRYGTSYAKWNPDGNGNITSMQIYCPDRVHPHSDLTGNCDKRLNAVYSKLLADSI